jgi:hypothetical protein
LPLKQLYSGAHLYLKTVFSGLSNVSEPDTDLKNLDQMQKFHFSVRLGREQSFSGLNKAFRRAGFDPARPGAPIGDIAFGKSFSRNDFAHAAQVYIFPQEAQSLRHQGYAVAIPPRFLVK